MIQLPPAVPTRRPVLVTLSLAAAVFLSQACARFHPEPIVPAETAASLERRALDDPGLRAFLQTNLSPDQVSWPLEVWTFDTLYLAALYYHPSLDLARAQWQVASAGQLTAAALPNPSLSAVPGRVVGPSEGLNPWFPSVTLDYLVETAGKRGYRKAQARHLSDAARLNLAAAAWQVRTALRAALIDLATAEARAGLLEQQLSRQRRIIQLLEQRLQAGAISSSEMTLVRIAQDQLLLELYSAQEQTADARVRVADAVGIPAAGLEQTRIAYEIARPTPQTSELLSQDVRRQALESRVDVLSALAEYAARQAALQLEIARQYPDVHLGPGYQFDQGEHKISLSITAELPIFNQNQGPIAEAHAKRAEAAAHFNAVQAKALTEIDRAVAAYRVAQTNMVALEDLAASQQSHSAQIEAQVRAGAGDQLDLINSQIELGASQLLQLGGRVKLQQSLAALEDAVQRPLDLPAPKLIERPPRPAPTSTSPP